MGAAPPPTTIIIGDVHGCARELDDLLEKCGFRAGTDELVFVGDLVAKGPDSLGVVERAMALGARAVRGNHEDAVLRARLPPVDSEAPKLRPTHQQVADALSESQWRWLEALPLTLPLPQFDTLVVHAGVVPGVPLQEQRAVDLMCMRTLRPDGTASKRLSDGELWGAHWPGPTHVCFGHDAITGLQQHPHALGLDTGCVYGRALTAWLLPQRQLCSVPARATYVPIE